MRRDAHHYAAWLLVAAASCAAPTAPHQPSPRLLAYLVGPPEPAKPAPCRPPLRELESELLDAGREPRRALRLSPEPDLRLRLALDEETQATSRAYDAAARGTTCHHLLIGDERGPGERLFPNSASLLITPRGSLLALTPNRTKGETALGDNLEAWMFESSPRFPEAPVGLGARWRVKDQGRRTTVVWTEETVTYELVGLQGDRVSLRVSLSRHQPAQELWIPGSIPEDEPIRAHGRLITSGYLLRLDLRRQPIPARQALTP